MTQRSKSLLWHVSYASLAALQLNGQIWAANLLFFLSWIFAIIYSAALSGLYLYGDEVFKKSDLIKLKGKGLPAWLHIPYILFFASQGQFLTALAWVPALAYSMTLPKQIELYLEKTGRGGNISAIPKTNYPG